MLDDELREGYRQTRKLMEEKGLTYAEARIEVTEIAPIPADDLQRAYYDARIVLQNLRGRRAGIEEDIEYTMSLINGLKRRALEVGVTLK